MELKKSDRYSLGILFFVTYMLWTIHIIFLYIGNLPTNLSPEKRSFEISGAWAGLIGMILPFVILGAVFIPYLLAMALDDDSIFVMKTCFTISMCISIIFFIYNFEHNFSFTVRQWMHWLFICSIFLLTPLIYSTLKPVIISKKMKAINGYTETRKYRIIEIISSAILGGILSGIISLLFNR